METNETLISQNTEVLLHLLEELALLERQSSKYFQKIRKAAFSPELSKALHEEQTSINDHINRLDLIVTELGNNNRTTKTKSSQKLPSLSSYGRKKSATRDLYMISAAQQVIHSKNVYYKLLTRLAIQLDLELGGTLTKQSVSDNEATLTWLDNTAQRIISNEQLILEVPN
jgi:ferritin-like metal-binding protein YciE